MRDKVTLNLAALALLALLTLFFTSIHEVTEPAVADCKSQPVLCARAGKVRCSTYTQRLCDPRKFPYCHALPIPFYRSLDDDYFDVWPRFGCERDLVPDDYPEEICGRIGRPFMCAPSPLAPLR